MGPNDSLPPPPPPPPPGQPNVPPIPAPPPGPAPQAQPQPAQFQPTQPVPPVPPVQGYPATQAYPQQMPPAEPTPEPTKNNLPWIIVGVVAAIAVVVGAVLVFGGGDDDSPTLGGDDTEVTLPVTVAPTSVPETDATEAGTDDTFVITAPESTQPVATVPPTVAPGGDGVISVTDDTNSFSLFFPDTFLTDTAPIDAQGVQFAQISGSEDLQSYVNDHDTFGITVLGAPADQVATAPELVGIFDPGAEVCTTRVPQSGYVTALGAAEVLLLDGCGTGGASAKVIMVVPVPDQNAVIVAVAQGAGPANSSLLEFTQAVVESVTPV